MTVSGPLRQPDSRRGSAEPSVEVIQDELVPPTWLKKKERDEFHQLIAKQREAGVGMRVIDAEGYAQYIRLCADFRESKDTRERLAIRRGLDALSLQLCIGEYARQRIGVRGKKQKQKSALALMIAKKDEHPVTGA